MSERKTEGLGLGIEVRSCSARTKTAIPTGNQAGSSFTE